MAEAQALRELNEIQSESEAYEEGYNDAPFITLPAATIPR